MAAKKFEFPRMTRVEDLVKLIRGSLGTVEKEFVEYDMSNISVGVEVTAGWSPVIREISQQCLPFSSL